VRRRQRALAAGQVGRRAGGPYARAGDLPLVRRPRTKQARAARSVRASPAGLSVTALSSGAPAPFLAAAPEGSGVAFDGQWRGLQTAQGSTCTPSDGSIPKLKHACMIGAGGWCSKTRAGLGWRRRTTRPCWRPRQTTPRHGGPLGIFAQQVCLHQGGKCQHELPPAMCRDSHTPHVLSPAAALCMPRPRCLSCLALSRPHRRRRHAPPSPQASPKDI